MKSLTLTAPGRLEWSTLPEADAPRAGERRDAVDRVGHDRLEIDGPQPRGIERRRPGGGQQHLAQALDPPGQPAEPLALRTGATTVLMEPHEQGAFVTVMGEVPLPTLQQFAGALKRHP